jgi:hypothetical protein
MNQLQHLQKINQDELLTYLTNPETQSDNVDNLAKLQNLIKSLTEVFDRAKKTVAFEEGEIFGKDYILKSTLSKSYKEEFSPEKVFHKILKHDQELAKKFLNETVKVSKKDVRNIARQLMLPHSRFEDCLIKYSCEPTKTIKLISKQDDTTNNT